MKKLYISDLDFTLLSHNSVISDYTKRNILLLLSEGINFSIASARSLTTIKEILGDIPFALPVITLNGAAIVDYHEEGLLSNTFMDYDKTLLIKNFLSEHGAQFILTTFNGKENKCWMPKDKNKSIENFYLERKARKDGRLRDFDHVEEIDFKSDQVICFTVIEKAQRSNELYQELKSMTSSANPNKPGLATDSAESESLFNFYPMGIDEGGWQWMTIQDRKANKGAGVKFLADHAKVEPRNLTVFGDNVNDISMFNVAGTALAVKNAPLEIQKHATGVIDYHHSDSVIKYILEQENL